MVQFTEDSTTAIDLLLLRELTPRAALRIFMGCRPGRPSSEVGLLMTTTSEFRPGDELVLSPAGVPVFIAPELVPLFNRWVIDGFVNEEGRPCVTTHPASASGEI